MKFTYTKQQKPITRTTTEPTVWKVKIEASGSLREIEWLTKKIDKLFKK